MFIDVSGAAPREQDKWPSIVIPKEAIDLEIARLIDAPSRTTAAAPPSSYIRTRARPAWAWRREPT